MLVLLVCFSFYNKNLEAVFSSLLFHSNRWKEDPTGIMNVAKGSPKGRFMKQRNKLYHLEAGKIEAITSVIISGMGNLRKIIYQL